MTNMQAFVLLLLVAFIASSVATGVIMTGQKLNAIHHAILKGQPQ